MQQKSILLVWLILSKYEEILPKFPPITLRQL